MFEIGDTLREARIRKGLTIKDVEDVLKIRAKYVQALEQDDFEVIPGPTFVKAFLRTYGEFLGLDTDILVGEYVSRFDTIRGDPPGASPRRTARPKTRPPRRRPNYVVVGVAAVIVILILIFLVGRRGEEPAVIEPGSLTTSTTVGGAAAPDALPPATAVARGGSPDGGVSASTRAGGGVALVIRVTQNRCWLIVREGSAEGPTVYSGTLEEGRQLSFSGADRYWLNIGNPSAVRLEIDGTDVNVPEPYGIFVASASGLERVR
ncbi:MAG: cytoskeleton protein RodZ [Thermoleophilia bacterium]